MTWCVSEASLAALATLAVLATQLLKETLDLLLARLHLLQGRHRRLSPSHKPPVTNQIEEEEGKRLVIQTVMAMIGQLLHNLLT